MLLERLIQGASQWIELGPRRQQAADRFRCGQFIEHPHSFLRSFKREHPRVRSTKLPLDLVGDELEIKLVGESR